MPKILAYFLIYLKGEFPMQVLTFSTPQEAAEYVSQEIIHAICSFQPAPKKPFFVLGLPTGSTPEPIYERLVDAYQKNKLSFKHVTSFNMDEYRGLPPEHPQSYHFFMNKHLFNHIDMPAEQIHILDGMSLDPVATCTAYEKKIHSLGGIDLQLGGIGENGHLAFNEPGTAFDSLTHLQQLTQNTIEVNARFFKNQADVPTQALTVGLGTIFAAQKVIIVATGSKKSEAVFKTVYGPVTEACPASMLQNHPNAFLICDKAAADRL